MSVKNTKPRKPRIVKKVAKKESPSISRSIPEAPRGFGERFFSLFRAVDSFKKNVLIISALLTIALIGQGYELYTAKNVLASRLMEREDLILDREKWREVTHAYPLYRDGYFMMAVADYRLGDTDRAKVNLEKTLEIDPNFIPGREFEKVLGE